MKVALAQMDVKPNQPRKNLETMLRMIDDAKSKNVDLIAFPELCISGYLVGDKFTQEDYCNDLMECNEILREASKGIAIVYGNIYVDKNDAINERVGSNGLHTNKDGRVRKYNAVYAFQNGQAVERAQVENNFDSFSELYNTVFPKGVQPKTLLPNYRFFDDERYFFSANDIAMDFGLDFKKLMQPFVFKDKNNTDFKIGLEVCEDLWCEEYKLNNESLNITKMLIENDAKSIINISASPWTYGKNNARDRRIEFLKKDVEKDGKKFVSFNYVNCIGAQNNGKNIVTFDGGSTIYNSDAKIVTMADAAYHEKLLIVENDKINSMSTLQRANGVSGGIQNYTKNIRSVIAEKYEAIITGLRHTKDMMGRSEHPRFVIGLSGGIDSAVVAALLCQAVGSDRVLGINMPTKYNSAKTKDAAFNIAKDLNIGYEVVPIQEIVDTVSNVLDKYDLDGSKRKLSDLNHENVQAKIRGTDLLSNIASKYGAIFTNNGNKLETALGYATLYGDVGGAIAPIADLTKEEVFEMARYINEVIYKKEVIPNKLIPDALFRFTQDQIQPSAELKNNQVDPMKFGYHDRILMRYMDYNKANITTVMNWYVNGTLEKNLGVSKELLQRWGIDNPETFVKDIEWFDKLFQTNVFKRIQSPTIIGTDKTFFGYDLRESMLPYNESFEQVRLKEKILQMKSYYDRK
jgi:NAD+ synthase (glutamine-hydrolysing)